jgi:hypothetical protein
MSFLRLFFGTASGIPEAGAKKSRSGPEGVKHFLCFATRHDQYYMKPNKWICLPVKTFAQKKKLPQSGIFCVFRLDNFVSIKLAPN